MMMFRSICARTVFALSLCWAPIALAADETRPEEENFLEFDITELVNITVTSISKTEQKLLDAPAAIYVLTSEDLKRSGAKTIPDALRLVPGMDVGQVSSNDYAVSARGFNTRFANKLLVLIDGRSIYTPTFGGVFWDAQHVLFDDVDRMQCGGVIAVKTSADGLKWRIGIHP